MMFVFSDSIVGYFGWLTVRVGMMMMAPFSFSLGDCTETVCVDGVVIWDFVCGWMEHKCVCVGYLDLCPL